MIVRAPRPTSHFTQVRNDVLRDRRLSFKARGLLVFMLSHPDYWRFRVEDLRANGPDGRHAVTSGLVELETAGYLQRHRRRADDGTYATRLVVFDTPQGENSQPVGDEMWTTHATTTDYPQRVTSESIEHGHMNIKQAVNSRTPRLCGKCKGSGRLVAGDGIDVEHCHQCGGGGIR